MKDFRTGAVVLQNGETIAYRQAGEGTRTLVLLHGNMSSSVFFTDLMFRLAPYFQIVALDMRGFGDSSYRQPFSSLAELAADVAEAAELLQLERFSVLGWSTGGGVALELAAARPDLVEKVVLVNSVALTGYPMFKKDANGQPILTELLKTREEVAVDPVQVLPILYAYSTGDRTLLRTIWNALIYHHAQPAPEVYEQHLDAMLKQRNLVDVDYALITFNMTAGSNGVVEGTGHIKNVSAPVIVIQGADDRVVPPVWSQQTAAALGAQATLHILEGAGHSPFTDQPAELARVLLTSLS